MLVPNKAGVEDGPHHIGSSVVVSPVEQMQARAEKGDREQVGVAG